MSSEGEPDTGSEYFECEGREEEERYRKSMSSLNQEAGASDRESLPAKPAPERLAQQQLEQPLQRQQSSPGSVAAQSDSPRARSLLERRDASKAQNRYSFPGPVPPIPARFLTPHLSPTRQRLQVNREAVYDQTGSPPSLRLHRASNDLTEELQEQIETGGFVSRRKSLPARPLRVNTDALEKLERGIETEAAMSAKVNGTGRLGRGEDLFLELANDQSGVEAEPQTTGRKRAASRLSISEKRRSLPAEESPSAVAGQGSKARSQYISTGFPRRREPAPELQRFSERFRMTAENGVTQADDTASVGGRSHISRAHRYSIAPDRSPMAPSRLGGRIQSPELPHYGRGRPYFESPQGQRHVSQFQHRKTQGFYAGSPVESTETKQSNEETTSTDSPTTDTVWDELDDLKSRIKKLELTGKLPASSGQAASNDQADRPRTATTAPTTIDSSPRREKQEQQEQGNPLSPTESKFSGSDSSTIHPLLHSSLVKAKQLLSPGLYHALEATATDALQLAAMTGSAGPQGTAFSAASIINGVTVSDRHVRRKADTMCRNLTDLTIALCEGKKETPVASPPVTYEAPTLKSTSSIRYPHGSLVVSEDLNAARPISRLEAHRSSILGVQHENPNHSPSLTPRHDSIQEDSTNEQQYASPSNPHNLDHLDQSRSGRATLHVNFDSHSAGTTTSGEEDDTVRPVSRAMTDVASFAHRQKPHSSYTSPSFARGEYHNPSQRSPSLRESLVARRHASANSQSNPNANPGSNARALEHNGENLRRAPSLASESSGGVRRRLLERRTAPSVVEETGGENDAGPLQSGKRRVLSLRKFGGRMAQRMEDGEDERRRVGRGDER